MKDYKEALRLAGKMATAAIDVLNSSPLELSGNLIILSRALDDYDVYIHSMMSAKEQLAVNDSNNAPDAVEMIDYNVKEAFEAGYNACKYGTWGAGKSYERWKEAQK